MKMSEKFDQVLPALHKARSQFVKVKKDKQNSHLKNKYATLDSVLDAVTPALTENDLIMMQDMIESDTPQKMRVETTIMHISGQWLKFYTELPIVKLDPQGSGSSFTYARRYAAAAALGLSQADDDAQIAVRSAQDWKRELDKCKTLDELQDVYKAAFKASDQASRIIINEHKDKIKAGLEVNTARGFNPATPKKNIAKVEDGEQETVKSAQSKQEIENFE